MLAELQRVQLDSSDSILSEFKMMISIEVSAQKTTFSEFHPDVQSR